jgi:hypothetical protein
VTVGGTVLTLNTDYVFLSSSQIETTVAPVNGVEVRIERLTEREALNAELQAGSALPAQDLNDNFRQTLFIAQEIVSTADQAETNSEAALAAVSTVLPYTIVPAVANIPASPTNGQRVEVTNSTGIQSFSPLNGLPAGFIGSTSVKVRLQWNTPVAANWNWIDAFAVNPDGRYVQIANLSSATNSPSTTTGANSAAVKAVQDSKVDRAGDAFTGNVTVPSLNGGPLAGLRNRIINGDFRVDQRNAGAVQTITAGAALAYTADRWYAYCTGANVNGQQITVAGTQVDPFRYQFSGAASVTGIGFGQRIEAHNCRDLAGTTAVLSVSLSNSLLTTVNWQAFYANTNDTFGTLASPTRTSIASGSFTVNSTYSRYSTAISVPVAATTGIEIVFTVGAQTSGTWVIGQVQLERSPVMTPFEQRPVGLDLLLCKRYFQWIPYTMQFVAAAAQNLETPVAFPVEMRALPTVSALVADPFVSASQANAAVNIFQRITPYGCSALLTSGAAGASSAVGYRASASIEL